VHGEFRALLASDAAHYYEFAPESRPSGGCCGPSGCGSALGNHSCTVLIEICERCNLSCPTCFAGSSPAHTQMMSLATFRERLAGLVAQGKAGADMIQLSGGEPTVHPDLLTMLDELFRAGFFNVTLNSNGIKLARPEFVAELARCVDRYEAARLYVYLQLDGFEPGTHDRLRGRADLLPLKRRALHNCIEAGLRVHPVMTLTRGINDHEVGAFVGLALEHAAIKHVVIQPAMYSGRYDNPRRADRLTLADAARLVAEQLDVFEPEDFGPIPCADPNCHAIAVAVRAEGELIPVSRYFPRYENWSDGDARELVEAFTDTINGPDGIAAAVRWIMSEDRGNGALHDLDEDTVDRLLDVLAGVDPDSRDLWDRLLTVSIKPFMDAWTYDQDRIDRCCVHILDSEGTPVSLCEFNAVTRPRSGAAARHGQEVKHA
jgi:hypothetical protein